MNSTRQPLDAQAIALMVLLCLVWGLGQVAVKLAVEGVSLVTQAAIRSAIATVLLVAWARWRDIPLFGRDGTLAIGLASRPARSLRATCAVWRAACSGQRPRW